MMPTTTTTSSTSSDTSSSRPFFAAAVVGGEITRCAPPRPQAGWDRASTMEAWGRGARSKERTRHRRHKCTYTTFKIRRGMNQSHMDETHIKQAPTNTKNKERSPKKKPDSLFMLLFLISPHITPQSPHTIITHPFQPSRSTEPRDPQLGQRAGVRLKVLPPQILQEVPPPRQQRGEGPLGRLVLLVRLAVRAHRLDPHRQAGHWGVGDLCVCVRGGLLSTRASQPVSSITEQPSTLRPPLPPP